MTIERNFKLENSAKMFVKLFAVPFLALFQVMIFSTPEVFFAEILGVLGYFQFNNIKKITQYSREELCRLLNCMNKNAIEMLEYKFGQWLIASGHDVSEFCNLINDCLDVEMQISELRKELHGESFNETMDQMSELYHTLAIIQSRKNHMIADAVVNKLHLISRSI